MKENYKLRLEDFLPGDIVLYSARNEDDKSRVNRWKIENRESLLVIYTLTIPPLVWGLTIVGLIKQL